MTSNFFFTVFKPPCEFIQSGSNFLKIIIAVIEVARINTKVFKLFEASIPPLHADFLLHEQHA